METYKSLLEALAIYGDSGSKGQGINDIDKPVKELDELVKELEESIKTIEIFLKKDCEFEIDKIIRADDTLHKIKFIQEGFNSICSNDEIRTKFGVLSREFSRSLKL